VAEPDTAQAPCSVCRGTRRCTYCNGDGYVVERGMLTACGVCGHHRHLHHVPAREVIHEGRPRCLRAATRCSVPRRHPFPFTSSSRATGAWSVRRSKERAELRRRPAQARLTSRTTRERPTSIRSRCAGHIDDVVPLPDGRYLLTLTGHPPRRVRHDDEPRPVPPPSGPLSRRARAEAGSPAAEEVLLRLLSAHQQIVSVLSGRGTAPLGTGLPVRRGP
jgi:hypothetical protein